MMQYMGQLQTPMQTMPTLPEKRIRSQASRIAYLGSLIFFLLPSFLYTLLAYLFIFFVYNGIAEDKSELFVPLFVLSTIVVGTISVGYCIYLFTLISSSKHTITRKTSFPENELKK